MKKIGICIAMMGFITHLQAQTKVQKSTTVKTTKAHKTIMAKKENTVSLNSTSSNKAYATSAINRLQISDTTIKAMNDRAAGANISISSSGIAGVPKGTYGFANGKIWLRKTTASTSGSYYGSGSVGTGTSILSAGTSEATIGVNGKSPDAGVSLWGDKRPTYYVPLRDSLPKQ